MEVHEMVSVSKRLGTIKKRYNVFKFSKLVARDFATFMFHVDTNQHIINASSSLVTGNRPTVK
jgi:hypothetical protein